MSIPQRRLPLSREGAPKARKKPLADAVSPAELSSSQPVSEALAATLVGRNAIETMVLKRLDDEKAQDIIFIDLTDKSSVADALVIASGRSHRHVGAIADHLLRALKDAGHGRAKVEGLPACDWVLIDAGDLVIHLFRPEVRSFYNIEKIWSVEPPARVAAH
jgi:ribosome-associated protein